MIPLKNNKTCQLALKIKTKQSKRPRRRRPRDLKTRKKPCRARRDLVRGVIPAKSRGIRR